MRKTQKGVYSLRLFLAATIVILIAGILVYQQRKIRNQWTTHTTGKPLNVTFSAPQNYEIEELTVASQTWSVWIYSEGNTIQMELCKECSFFDIFRMCGHSTLPEEEYQCETSRSQELSNGQYTAEVFKSNPNLFASILGNINKEDGSTLDFRVITADFHVPTDEEYEIIDRILESVH